MFVAISEEFGKIKKITKFPTVVIYKHFDEKINIFDENAEISEKNLLEFVEKHEFEKVMHFDKRSSQKIFGERFPTLILFITNDDKNFEALSKFKSMADDLRQHI